KLGRYARTLGEQSSEGYLPTPLLQDHVPDFRSASWRPARLSSGYSNGYSRARTGRNPQRCFDTVTVANVNQDDLWINQKVNQSLRFGTRLSDNLCAENLEPLDAFCDRSAAKPPNEIAIKFAFGDNFGSIHRNRGG